jgi:tungstate transport system substrate-binding protein
MISRGNRLDWMRWPIALVVLLALAPLVAGCGSSSSSGKSSSSVKYGQLILATTTSVKDSGLLDSVVLPAFKTLHPDITVKTVAIGSGDAIAMAKRGDADVLIVHSPSDESAFMAAGEGTFRIPFAYNYFTIVGPASDPAAVKGSATAAEAFKKIAQKQALFVSRGDASGTNKKELKIWNDAGVTGDPAQPPKGSWYITTGQGMGATLQVASQKQGYTLTDLATYLSAKTTLQLVPLIKQSKDLKNQYDVILLNQAKHNKVNAAAAELLAAYLVSADGQAAIGAYGADKYGQALFFPDAGEISVPLK